MTQSPLASVIIPTYNSERSVLAAVESVLRQTWPQKEVIVIDDGSTDRTREGLRPLMERIHYRFQEHTGRSAARNRGICMSRGDYVAFLDADDTWDPKKLERQLSAHRDYPSATWSYCKTKLVGSDGIQFQSRFWPAEFGGGSPGPTILLRQLLRGGLEIHTSTVIVQRQALLRAGGFDEELETSEDTEMWIRLSHSGCCFFLNEVLATRAIDTTQTFRDRYEAYNTSANGPAALRRAVQKLNLTAGGSEVAREGIVKAHQHSALMELLAGNPGAAEQHWDTASGLANRRLTGSHAGAVIAQFALSAARYHRRGPYHAIEILNEILGSEFMAAQLDGAARRAARMQLFAAIAHLFYRKNERAMARIFAAKAVMSSPGIGLRDRGLLRIALAP